MHELVVVERPRPEGIGRAELEALQQSVGWCLDVNGVRLLQRWLGSDRVVCLMGAPDAEAVRRFERTAGLPSLTIWPCRAYGPLRGLLTGEPLEGQAADKPESVVIVERTFPEPVVFEEVQAIEDAASWCLNLHQVTFGLSVFSFQRTRMLCLYRAPDAEAVRISQRKAKLPFDRIWAAEPLAETAPDVLRWAGHDFHGQPHDRAHGRW